MLVHGGMAQDVGPILEMVTEKYLLRSRGGMGRAAGGDARSLDEILAHLRGGRRARRSARPRTRNFFGPIQTIIPWASNLYTETLIDAGAQASSATTSGASGCSAACRAAAWASSSTRAESRGAGRGCRRSCARPSGELERAVPFAMEPVVYDFAINERGTFAELLDGDDGADAAGLLHPDGARAAADRTAHCCRRPAAPSWTASARPAARDPSWRGMVQTLFDRLLPRARRAGAGADQKPGRAAGALRL